MHWIKDFDVVDLRAEQVSFIEGKLKISRRQCVVLVQV